jgi:hypothetical protein
MQFILQFTPALKTKGFDKGHASHSAFVTAHTLSFSFLCSLLPLFLKFALANIALRG